jgi:hypothetical protein
MADAVQMAFLLLVAGNATMVNMIALVRDSGCSEDDISLTRPHRASSLCFSIPSSWPS